MGDKCGSNKRIGVMDLLSSKEEDEEQDYYDESGEEEWHNAVSESWGSCEPCHDDFYPQSQQIGCMSAILTANLKERGYDGAIFEGYSGRADELDFGPWVIKLAPDDYVDKALRRYCGRKPYLSRKDDDYPPDTFPNL